jgi:hypothetical protein
MTVVTKPGVYRTKGGARVELFANDNKSWPFWNRHDGYYDADGDSWEHRYGNDQHAGMSVIVGPWVEPAEAKSPVRTRTVTEIVPGTYGIVQIFERTGISQRPYVCIENRSWDAQDLRAAAATLTQLADALDAQARERQS